MTKIECNGIVMEPLKNPFIPKMDWHLYDDRINVIREEFKAEHANEFSGRYNTGHYTEGWRFKTNEDIMIRIISACPTKAEFESDVNGWIRAALDDCARADYWYTFEKDWGHNDD